MPRLTEFMSQIRREGMQACYKILERNAIFPEKPIDPAYRPLYTFHGRIMSTFSALPQDGKIWEIIQRIARLITAPFMYIALGIAALARCCIPERKEVEPSLIETIFDINKENFANCIAYLLKSKPMKKTYISLEVSHKERGSIFSHSIQFNTPEWEKLLSEVIDPLASYESFQKTYRCIQQKIMQEVMNAEISQEQKNIYRDLPYTECDKVTYRFTGIAQDTSGVFHEEIFLDDRSIPGSGELKWHKQSFTDIAKLDLKMRDCFEDKRLLSVKTLFVEELSTILSTRIIDCAYLRLTVKGSESEAHYDIPLVDIPQDPEQVYTVLDETIQELVTRDAVLRQIAGIKIEDVHVNLTATFRLDDNTFSEIHAAKGPGIESVKTALYAQCPECDDTMDLFFFEN